jgi:hypothetical protein
MAVAIHEDTVLPNKRRKYETYSSVLSFSPCLAPELCTLYPRDMTSEEVEDLARVLVSRVPANPDVAVWPYVLHVSDPEDPMPLRASIKDAVNFCLSRIPQGCGNTPSALLCLGGIPGHFSLIRVLLGLPSPLVIIYDPLPSIYGGWTRAIAAFNEASMIAKCHGMALSWQTASHPWLYNRCGLITARLMAWFAAAPWDSFDLPDCPTQTEVKDMFYLEKN